MFRLNKYNHNNYTKAEINNLTEENLKSLSVLWNCIAKGDFALRLFVYIKILSSCLHLLLKRRSIKSHRSRWGRDSSVCCPPSSQLPLGQQPQSTDWPLPVEWIHATQYPYSSCSHRVSMLLLMSSSAESRSKSGGSSSRVVVVPSNASK